MRRVHVLEGGRWVMAGRECRINLHGAVPDPAWIELVYDDGHRELHPVQPGPNWILMCGNPKLTITDGMYRMQLIDQTTDLKDDTYSVMFRSNGTVQHPPHSFSFVTKS